MNQIPYRKAEVNMKRIISILMTLCLLMACAQAAAESPGFRGKPWINSNLYGLWPSERPAVEETFELYANYDLYQGILAKGEGDRMINPIGEAQRLEMRQAASLYTDPEGKGPEAECH